jgi:hypothetical protein
MEPVTTSAAAPTAIAFVRHPLIHDALVMATCWQVADGSTVVFARAFHHGLATKCRPRQSGGEARRPGERGDTAPE